MARLNSRTERPLSFATAPVLVAIGAIAVACSAESPSPDSTGSAGSGSPADSGGTSQGGGSGGQATAGTGTSVPLGGSLAAGGSATGPTGGAAQAGTSATATGGAPSSAGSAGTATMAGAPSAGQSGGGAPSSAGAGGQSTGGTAAGGSPASGGTAGAGGSGGDGGKEGGNCPFPTSFKWTSTGPLAEPKSPAGRNFVSLKDFTIVHWNNLFHVYATVFDQTANGWSSVYFNFDDFSKAAAAPQVHFTKNAVAPTLIYFTPKKQWVLLYQWGFQYATTTDPSQPSSWSASKSLLSGDTSSVGGTGPIDQTAICDSENCYLFYAADNGKIYRSSMPIGDFPGTFRHSNQPILSDTTNNLFEGVQVYTVKGTGEYLMIVEAIGSGGRYFRAFRSNNLGGTFTPIPGASTETTPFAGKNNVTFEGNAWTNDISHGDIVRMDPSETQTIDPCNMQFLYQGFDKTKSTSNYSLVPYRPGLLTKTN